MGNTPSVSAIVNVYNGDRFLEDALKSIKSQTFSSIDLIVVDDGSTDNSAAIAQKLEGIQVIQHKQNMGAPTARNTGIKAANTEFIAFLDADDIWLPSKTEKQVEFLQSNPQIGFCFTLEEFIYDDPNNVASWYKRDIFQLEHPAFWASSYMARKEVFDQIGLFDTTLINADITEWMMRAKDQHIHYQVIEEVLLHRRIHDSNLSSNLTIEKQELLASLRSSILRQRRRDENQE
jgi:glycosyltransferase involved in cell wall biosynthesis